LKWRQDLIKDIRFNDHRDNADHGRSFIVRETKSKYPHDEFTECNRNALTEKFLKVRDNCKAILEIGVARNKEKSSAYVFLNNKLESTKYVGIDIEDKSFLNDASKNIYTIKNSSSNIDENMVKIRELGVEQFDFILIDGWHSVNQVLLDWEYTSWLSPNGIVAFHDTSEHPGPFLFVRNLNTDKWNVEINVCPEDWGIGFAWLK
jgi:hypothetical protein